MEKQEQFQFAISLSILNHLGRNLYRSFSTILGEAISNAWDAEANNVHIYILKDKNSFIIIDDGNGMNNEDFQNKFLKIGYSKRKYGENRSSNKLRPFIGRKGIGKLALLSCAEKVTILSKKEDMSEYIGGTINNSGLDKAINDDITPDKYSLEEANFEKIKPFCSDHKKGTIIYFEDMHETIKNSVSFLRKLIALYFRFSLIDTSFNIFVDDSLITTQDLKDLGDKTQFLWNINNLKDPFVTNELPNVKEIKKLEIDEKKIDGFICSVDKPKSLNILGTGERVSIDLFVNGRIREKNILKHIPSSRIVESYLYGQIHFNDLDLGEDRFTSSREGILSDDPLFKKLLDILEKKILGQIIEDWDIFRTKHKLDGDSENSRISKKDRKSTELFNAVSDDYSPDKEEEIPIETKKKIESWIDDLSDDAKFNFGSYAECFISENLIRNYITEHDISLSPKAEKDVKKFREQEETTKKNGNISIDIREKNSDLSYLDMDNLCNLVDKTPDRKNDLTVDSKAYKPIRNALMHTSQLTGEAKNNLTSTYHNIKGRVKKLIYENKE